MRHEGQPSARRTNQALHLCESVRSKIQWNDEKSSVLVFLCLGLGGRGCFVFFVLSQEETDKAQCLEHCRSPSQFSIPSKITIGLRWKTQEKEKKTSFARNKCSMMDIA